MSARLRSFDMNLLRVLDALLAERSTVRAGARVGLSQPAVSASLARLRHALDDPLFVRQGRGLVPTDRARALQAPLRRLLQEAEALLAAPAFDPAAADRRFRIAGIDFFALLLMPALARVMSVAGPGLSLHQVNLVPERYVATLEQEDTDLALMPEQPFPDWIAHEALFQSPFAIISRLEHPALAGLDAGDALPLDTFCALPHAAFSVEGRPRAQTDAVLAEIGRKRHLAVTVASFPGLFEVVRGTDLLALAPVQLARHAARAGDLALWRAPAVLALPVPNIVMAWHRRSEADPGHRWLRDRVRAALTPLDAAR